MTRNRKRYNKPRFTPHTENTREDIMMCVVIFIWSLIVLIIMYAFNLMLIERVILPLGYDHNTKKSVALCWTFLEILIVGGFMSSTIGF